MDNNFIFIWSKHFDFYIGIVLLKIQNCDSDMEHVSKDNKIKFVHK